MELLVLCPHFAPDTAPTGEVMTAIARGLTDQGHRLRVVTALPWYRRHAVEPGWEGRLVRHEDVPWGRVTRLHPFPTDKRNIPARALAFGAFTLESTVAGLVGARPDGVFAMSPPLTLGLAGALAARRWGVPFVFNIQDVFPDVAIEVGKLTDPRLIRAARRLERTCYRLSDAVTVLSEELRANVAAKLGPDSRVRVEMIPNFVDLERVTPGDRRTAYRAELGLGDEPGVMYAGNVGFSQSLELLLAGARAMPSVTFVVNGEGSARPDLERAAAGLPNVRFADYQPRGRLAEVLASADLHLVPLRRGLAKASVPSKLYSILAAGRPVLASVDEGTEVARTVEAAGAGRAVPPEDEGAFLAALADLLRDPVALAATGAAGRSFVETWVSPAAVAGRYAALFEDLRAARAATTGRP
jgi:colanic acid biosynthesis glycosyl transferase WcaI